MKNDDVALNGAFWTHKKSGVQISLKKWNPFVTDEFSSETLILRKRLSILFMKCIHLLPGPSQLFCTSYVGEMMIPCQLSTFSEFIGSAFQFQGHLAKKWVNAWKIPNEVRKGWSWWHGFEWCMLNAKNVQSCNKLKKWNVLVTDEFSSETLILRKRLSLLYTKCIQFFS